MKKEEVEQLVSKHVASLMSNLAEYEEGGYGEEEYGRNVWDKKSIQKICQEVFNKTYDVMNEKNLRIEEFDKRLIDRSFWDMWGSEI